MRKNIFRLMMLAALPMLLGLGITSCAEHDNPVPQDRIETVEAPDDALPAIDQMNIRVTVPMSAAVMADFEEGTTGAALVKRMPQVTASVTPETSMVILPGSDFSVEGTPSGSYNFMEVVRILCNGGYIALLNPTNEQAAMFSITLLAGLMKIEQQAYEQMFDISEAAAARAAQHSETVERLRARTRNLQAAATRADSDDFDLNAPYAEILIFGLTDYFMQEPLPDEATSYVHIIDAEGNESAPETVTTKTERTPYVSGGLADAAAEWLNTVERESGRKSQAIRRNTTRAASSTVINEIMDASETFTYNGCLYFTDEREKSVRRTNRVNMRVYSWGIHNMETGNDYYYLKQCVTLSMGARGSNKVYYPLAEDTWYKASFSSRILDRWFGAWLDQYETSIQLTGEGDISIMASAPSTDNDNATTSVTTGSSTSTTITNGISYGANIGANSSGGMGNVSLGGSHSVGTTSGTSFSVGTSTSHKELRLTKNSDGARVTWKYKANHTPKFYRKNNNLCHEIPDDILVNDCDLTDEVCYMVKNPTGQYTVNIASTPQTNAIAFWSKEAQDRSDPSYYIPNAGGAATYTQTLMEPNRAMQTWRMNITIDEWSGTPVVGALGDLEQNIHSAFPDLYVNVFKVADKTPTSLNTISAIVSYTKQVLGNRLDILQSYARSWGIKQFTIHWSCDDLNVKTREGFAVKAD